MAFLATLLGYLGTVTGIVVALLMSYHGLLSTPNQGAMPQPTLTVAAKPSEPKIAPATKLPGRSGAQRASAMDARRRPRAVSVMARQQNIRRADRQQQAKRWAYQLAPDFESRYMGYVDDPSADSSRFR